LIWLLKIDNWIPLDSSAMMTEIVGKQRLILCFFSLTEISGRDPIFQGSKIWIGVGWARPPCLNRQNYLCRSSFCHLLWKILFWLFSYCPIELPCVLSSSSDGERRGGEDGGWASVVWESAGRDMSVIVISPSWYISHRDGGSSPVVIAWWHTSIGADDLVPGYQFFRGWGSF